MASAHCSIALSATSYIWGTAGINQTCGRSHILIKGRKPHIAIMKLQWQLCTRLWVRPAPTTACTLSERLKRRRPYPPSNVCEYIISVHYSELCLIKFVFKNKKNIILPANWAFCHVIIQAVTAFFLYLNNTVGAMFAPESWLLAQRRAQSPLRQPLALALGLSLKEGFIMARLESIQIQKLQ